MCCSHWPAVFILNNCDSRVSHRVGRILRATSLDELPQFWNVLKGDMSLIGFRFPPTYHPWSWEQYTEEQEKMFTLRPGITGWAQVNGCIAMNCWYAENVLEMGRQRHLLGV